MNVKLYSWVHGKFCYPSYVSTWMTEFEDCSRINNKYKAGKSLERVCTIPEITTTIFFRMDQDAPAAKQGPKLRHIHAITGINIYSCH